MARPWIKKLRTNLEFVFSDWEPYCQSWGGVEVSTSYVDKAPDLPIYIQEGANRLKDIVPDEKSAKGNIFNGPRYYVRKVTHETRRSGETPGCHIEFGPSDYRNFLVTNGIDKYWAEKAGLADQWESTIQWAEKIGATRKEIGFFENSFGVNVLITTVKENGTEYALFRERGDIAIRQGTTVGSVDEGLRRKFEDELFDQKSDDDPAPDIEKAISRALNEESGILLSSGYTEKPKILSVGYVRSIYQPGALVHVRTRLNEQEIIHALTIATDGKLEFKGSPYFVEFSRESLISFFEKQENHAPVETWTGAMAFYALGAHGVARPRVFISHSSKDKRFVRNLGSSLQDSGISVWIDEAEIKIGDSLIGKLREAIDSVDYVIAVISENSIQSEWVKKELDVAMNHEIKGCRVKVLPVRKDKCDLPGFLEGKLYSDLSNKHKRKTEIQRLINSVLKR